MPLREGPAMRRCWACACTTDQRKKFYNPSLKEYVEHFVCDPECEAAIIERYEHMEAECALHRSE